MGKRCTAVTSGRTVTICIIWNYNHTFHCFCAQSKNPSYSQLKTARKFQHLELDNCFYHFPLWIARLEWRSTTVEKQRNYWQSRTKIISRVWHLLIPGRNNFSYDSRFVSRTIVETRINCIGQNRLFPFTKMSFLLQMWELLWPFRIIHCTLRRLYKALRFTRTQQRITRIILVVICQLISRTLSTTATWARDPVLQKSFWKQFRFILYTRAYHITSGRVPLTNIQLFVRFDTRL